MVSIFKTSLRNLKKNRNVLCYHQVGVCDSAESAGADHPPLHRPTHHAHRYPYHGYLEGEFHREV